MTALPTGSTAANVRVGPGSPPPAPDEVEAALDRLRRQLAGLGSAVVAFSAGVDSSLVLAVAVEQLGDRAVAAFGRSASVPAGELEAARSLARQLGARLLERDTDELSDPAYVANAPDRCFHCKRELFAVCWRVARELTIPWVLDGTQADDLGDTRPGLRAASQGGVRSPLVECGLDKAMVRALARQLGLPNWDKPAGACLASRIPHGTPVTRARLAAVDAVEQVLRRAGFRQVRARHRDDELLLQVEPDRVAGLQRATRCPPPGSRRLASDIGPAVESAADSRTRSQTESQDDSQGDPPNDSLAACLDQAVRAGGFHGWRIDPDGYRSPGTAPGSAHSAARPVPAHARPAT